MQGLACERCSVFRMSKCNSTAHSLCSPATCCHAVRNLSPDCNSTAFSPRHKRWRVGGVTILYAFVFSTCCFVLEFLWLHDAHVYHPACRRFGIKVSLRAFVFPTCCFVWEFIWFPNAQAYHTACGRFAIEVSLRTFVFPTCCFVLEFIWFPNAQVSHPASGRFGIEVSLRAFIFPTCCFERGISMVS